jgi:hypothetical protein
MTCTDPCLGRRFQTWRPKEHCISIHLNPSCARKAHPSAPFMATRTAGECCKIHTLGNLPLVTSLSLLTLPSFKALRTRRCTSNFAKASDLSELSPPMDCWVASNHNQMRPKLKVPFSFSIIIVVKHEYFSTCRPNKMESNITH